jgi:phosphohistidine swiveling domain-containing protein
MIIDLDDIRVDQALDFGVLIKDLVSLRGAPLSVIPSVVLSGDSFAAWQGDGAVSEDSIRRLLTWAEGIGDGYRSNELMIRVSFRQQYQGLEDKVRTPKSFSRLRHSIERIYRSWGDERASASRTVKGIPDDAATPTLLIQPWIENPQALLTCNAISGALTTEADYRDNINNSITSYPSWLYDIVRRTDRQLLRPVKLTLIVDEPRDNAVVLSVSEALITSDGRWRSFARMMDAGWIDGLQFIRTVEPDMLGYFSGWSIEAEGVVSGQPAYPGMSFGTLVFRETASKMGAAESTPFVFLTTEVVPDDIHILERSIAIVTLRGGMTSHAAVISRGMKKPAVVGCCGSLVPEQGVYVTPNGYRVPEHSDCIVDGSDGRVWFVRPQVRERWQALAQASDLIERVLRILHGYNTEQFGQLNLGDQQHLAAIKSRLRQLGRVPQ